MSKKITTEEFIARAVNTHGDKYDYSLVEYTHTDSNVNIICTEHGIFLQSPHNHLQGQNCPHCAKILRALKQSSNTCEFIDKAQKIHGDAFDYTHVEYTHKARKVKIFCNRCSEFFFQTPNNHLNGLGCRSCRGEILSEKTRDSIEGFRQKFARKFGDKYDFSMSVYGRNRADKISVRCYVHGQFDAYPSNLLGGSGCPSCAKTGFDGNKTGYLYVLHTCDLVKVGITNKHVSERVKKISKSKGVQFKVLKLYTCANGNDAYTIEQSTLTYLRGLYKQPSEKFEGYTECFYDVNQADLLNKIEQTIKELQIEHH